MHRKAPKLLEDIRDADAELSGRSERLPRGLYVLTPETSNDKWLITAVVAAIRGGASTVQYRNKTLGSTEQLRQARALRRACRDAGATFLINDSVELATEVEADGVHLGRDDGNLAIARAVLGPSALIGVSCYDSLERALQTRDVADYCAFGSVFPSRVKPTAVRAPLELFRQAHEAGLHAVAIGGIHAENAGEVARAGAEAVAVITAVFGEVGTKATDANEIEYNARRIVKVLETFVP